MTDAKIVGITGKLGVGKTTAADFLIERGFVKVGFKDAIVKEITERFPNLLIEIAKHEPFDPTMRTKGPLLRALMQHYGTEVRRRDDEHYWIKAWKATAYSHIIRGKSVVCDDVRFLNEVEAIRELGGKIIRLTRPDVTTTGSHASEVEMDAIEPDLTIETPPGDLGALQKALADL